MPKTALMTVKEFEAVLAALEKLPAKPGTGFAKIKVKEKLAELCAPVEGCEECEFFETKCVECLMYEEAAHA
tara:strand:- start:853 stop:1068 length:216 start_codon:yes stop_codon:yes gene_type:complete